MLKKFGYCPAHLLLNLRRSRKMGEELDIHPAIAESEPAHRVRLAPRNISKDRVAGAVDRDPNYGSHQS
jgi:hypothetical protein